MKARIIVTFILLTLCSAALAQPTDLVKAPLHLRIGQTNGSGFFLVTSNFLYLVTARHCLFAESVDPRPLIDPTLTISWIDDAEVAQTGTFKLLLLSANARYHTNRDVAVVRVGKERPGGITTYPRALVTMPANRAVPMFSLAMIRQFKDVKAAEDAYTLGYPGIGDPSQRLNPDRPLVQKGVVSDKDPVTRQLILSLPVFHGNSGGPVFSVSPYTMPVRYHIIGIAVQFVPVTWELPLPKINGKTPVSIDNAGYSIAEPIDFALELIDEVERTTPWWLTP